MKIRLTSDTTIQGDVTFEEGDIVDLNGYRLYVSGVMTTPGFRVGMDETKPVSDEDETPCSQLRQWVDEIESGG